MNIFIREIIKSMCHMVCEPFLDPAMHAYASEPHGVRFRYIRCVRTAQMRYTSYQCHETYSWVSRRHPDCIQRTFTSLLPHRVLISETISVPLYTGPDCSQDGCWLTRQLRFKNKLCNSSSFMFSRICPLRRVWSCPHSMRHDCFSLRLSPSTFHRHSVFTMHSASLPQLSLPSLAFIDGI